MDKTLKELLMIFVCADILVSIDAGLNRNEIY
ncbi:hypothetical protein LCGC14_2128920 [marine sediment metagenome]|uniref:Uncharacterized protein n=1 Tax=marine sediment metagenome TaxID=412755 RepID=A0A0F9E226_9ZZZZ